MVPAPPPVAPAAPLEPGRRNVVRLMNRHGIDPDDFLEKVHDIDYSWLVPDPGQPTDRRHWRGLVRVGTPA